MYFRKINFQVPLLSAKTSEYQNQNSEGKHKSWFKWWFHQIFHINVNRISRILCPFWISTLTWIRAPEKSNYKLFWVKQHDLTPFENVQLIFAFQLRTKGKRFPFPFTYATKCTIKGKIINKSCKTYKKVEMILHFLRSKATSLIFDKNLTSHFF